LQQLGVVSHISSHGYIILKAAVFPRIGSAVRTKRMKKVGVVHDIFGPVISPYISVKPFKHFNRDDLNSLLGEKVYV
jgi:rRNA processing protein Gar1